MTDAVEDRVRNAMVQEDEPAEAETAETGARRPIASRNAAWARNLAGRLVLSGATPNQISMASVGFALLAFLLFWWAGNIAGAFARAFVLILAALAVQGRLLCNLLDGLVAIEGGMKEKDGAFWNEFPDRAADILILGGLGLAAGRPGLGFLAAALAVTAAYVRELARANGGEADYRGPMAKQHRMAAVTAIAVLAAFWPIWGNAAWFIHMGLWVIILGTIATIGLRAQRHIVWLRAKA